MEILLDLKFTTGIGHCCLSKDYIHLTVKAQTN